MLHLVSLGQLLKGGDALGAANVIKAAPVGCKAGIALALEVVKVGDASGVIPTATLVAVDRDAQFVQLGTVTGGNGKQGFGCSFGGDDGGSVHSGGVGWG